MNWQHRLEIAQLFLLLTFLVLISGCFSTYSDELEQICLILNIAEQREIHAYINKNQHGVLFFGEIEHLQQIAVHIKGTVSRDFRPSVFLINQYPWAP
jgi:hypothetical protein